MNLHEECLLKYLLNPMGLCRTTELLKLNNTILSEDIKKSKGLVKTGKINYTALRA